MSWFFFGMMLVGGACVMSLVLFSVALTLSGRVEIPA
jgi:hypothetical protein